MRPAPTQSPSPPPSPPEEPTHGRTLRGLVRYFFGLGSWGFGGPIALAGYMHRDLVADRRWFTEDEYQQGLAISQAMPGPLAAQLAMWLGYLQRGWLGALAVSLPFIVPPFLIVTAIAVLYAEYQGLGIVQDLFYGIAPAVLAIIAIASYKLARATNKADPVLWVIAVVQAVATVIAGAELVWPFIAAAVFGAIYYGGGLPRLSRQASGLSPLPLIAVVKGFACMSTTRPSRASACLAASSSHDSTTCMRPACSV